METLEGIVKAALFVFGISRVLQGYFPLLRTFAGAMREKSARMTSVFTRAALASVKPKHPLSTSQVVASALRVALLGTVAQVLTLPS
jgi:hypothetical protein